MKLRVLPSRLEFFQHYAAWCAERKRAVDPLFPKASAYIWIWEEQHGLVLGGGLFQAPGVVLCEEVVGNPAAPARVAHAAVLLLAEQFVAFCTLHDCYPLAHMQSRGVVRTLQRVGFVFLPGVAMTRHPFVQRSFRPKPRPAKTEQPKAEVKKKPTAKKQSRRRGPQRKQK